MSINYGTEEEYSEYMKDPSVPDTPMVESQFESDEPPVDRYNFVFWIMFLQGTGVLFAWNSFISAPDYFIRVYKNPGILSTFSLFYSYPNLVGLLFMIIIGNKINLKFRILTGYAISILLVLIIPILAFAKVENFPEIGAGITYASLFCIALATAVLQGSIFGLAGSLPSSYMVCAMAGNGMAGILVSLIRVVSKLIVERGGAQPSLQDLTISTAIYFFITCIVLVLCFITFIFMMRTEFITYYLKKSEQSSLSKISKKESYGVIHNLRDPEEKNKSIFVKIMDGIKQIFVVSKKIWVWELSVFAVFFITIGLFPSFIGYMKSSNGKIMENWLPVVLICTFNIFDFIGRASPGYMQLSKFSTALSVLLRLIFVPMFIACVVPYKIVRHDFFPICFMALMSLTNGYLSSLCMMMAPQECEPNERITAGTIMTFMLVFGIVMGANLGTLLTKILF